MHTPYDHDFTHRRDANTKAEEQQHKKRAKLMAFLGFGVGITSFIVLLFIGL